MKTLSDLLVADALQPEVAQEYFRRSLEKLGLKLSPFLSTPRFGHPEDLDELIEAAAETVVLLAALRELASGKVLGEIRLLEVKIPALKGVGEEKAAGAKGGPSYPSQRFGLTLEQAILPLNELNSGVNLSRLREFSLLRRAGITNLGELVERAKGVPKRLAELPGVGDVTLAHFQAIFAAYPAIAAAVGKERRRGKKGKPSAPAAPTAEPWQAFGLSQQIWEKPLKSLFPKGFRSTNKVRRLIGRRRITVGQLCEATQLKPTRIGRFFGRGCGPETRKLICTTIWTLTTPAAPDRALETPTEEQLTEEQRAVVKAIDVQG